MNFLRLAPLFLLLTALTAVASLQRDESLPGHLSSSPDYENRYVQVTDTAHGTFTYQYDHRTRRVGRDESQAGGSAEIISFSGGTSVQEYPANAANAPPAVEYIRGSDYGGGIGGILYTLRGGQPAFNSYNSRGDVVSQTDSGGDITWQAAYEAFGTRTAEEGTNNDRQKANTKDEDKWGALNEGMRYRDLEFGTFLTRDPLGHVDGPNEYAYVSQNPWTFFDPLGLQRRHWHHLLPYNTALLAGVPEHIMNDKEFGLMLDASLHGKAGRAWD